MSSSAPRREASSKAKAVMASDAGDPSMPKSTGAFESGAPLSSK